MSDNISAFNSDDYDYNIKLTLPYYEEIYKQVVDTVRIYNDKPLTWLDVGCGTGKMAQVALEHLKIDKFTFCDSSQEMIDIAKNRFDLPITDFLVSDIQRIKLDKTFDVVTAIQVNHYLHKSQRKTALKNCFNSLKDDGIFISFENFAPYSDLGTRLYLDRWKRYQTEHGKSDVESQNHIDRYNKSYFPISISEHLSLMKESGFRAVEILWLSYMQAGFIGIK